MASAPRRQVRAGQPCNPSYYEKGLQVAIDRGGIAVADYLRRYLSKPPSDGYRKLEDAKSFDLACEALIAGPGQARRVPVHRRGTRSSASASRTPPCSDRAADDEEANGIKILALVARHAVALVSESAYASLGKIEDAKQTFSHVLEIDGPIERRHIESLRQIIAAILG